MQDSPAHSPGGEKPVFDNPFIETWLSSRTVHIGTAFTIPPRIRSSLRTVPSGAAFQRRIEMKTSLFVGGLFLMLLIAGCNSTTPAAQGQPGPPGVAGQTGQTGQVGQAGQPR